MKASHSQSLREAVQKLPERSPRSDTWSAIEQRLDFDNAVRATFPHLPIYTPDADAWRVVEERLLLSRRGAFGSTWRYAAAVAVWLVVSLGTYFLMTSTSDEPRPMLTYHEEIAPVYEAPLRDTEDESEQELWMYIRQLCQEPTPPTCHDPEFVALRSHLAELTEEEKTLQQAIEQFGHDPQLVKYQIRIENMKADAAKELIQMSL